VEETVLLAGDIGGTKTNLAVFSLEAGPRAPLAEASFSSTDYPSLEAVAREFLAQVDLDVERASFGVAGPVIAGRAKVTNLPWVINEAQLREALGFSSVRLLNDLESIANAIPFLEPADLHTLNEGQPEPGGAMAVIAPGTGLGEAYLTWDGAHYRAHASKDGGSYLEPDWLAEQLAATDDSTPVIVSAALRQAQGGVLNGAEEPCEICVAALDIFVSILGAEAGNLALKVLATGGIHLGGGIPSRILPALEQGRFMEAFCNKGRMSDLLTRMPVHVILNPKVALLGAACQGLEL
jgi:glucokinase